MITIKYSIRPFVKNDTNQVAIRVRWNNRSYEVTFITGVYAEMEKWDAVQQKAQKGTSHTIRTKKFTAQEINQCIAEFIEEIEAAFAAFATKNSMPRAKELKEYVNTSLGRDQKTADAPPPPASLKELFDRFIRECGRERNWNSEDIGRYKVVYRHLVSAVPGITPYNITKESMFALRDWYVTKNYKNRTIHAKFVFLKCFLTWINNQEGYKIPKDVLSFKTNEKVIGKTITYLTYEELKMFTDFELSSERFGRARDLWCFMAYTSLRYSDLKRLNRAHINGNCICMLAEKTDGKLTIPLTEGAKKIMSRFSDGPNGEIFAVPANHLLNSYVREAAKEAGLDRIIIDTYYVGSKKYETPKKLYDIISCHDARRTFVSCSLAMGIPPEVVMKCTGHTGYNTMQPYIETSSDTVSLEMDKWNRSQNRLKITECLGNASEAQLEQLLSYAKSLGL